MKKLLINGEVFNEAERIVVDRSKGAIIGYRDEQEVFALRGVNFNELDYEVVGGEEVPEPDRVTMLEDENAFLAFELVTTQFRLDQTEQEQADLIFALVEGGVL